MTIQDISEKASTLTAAPVKGSSGEFVIQLITPGWGSSGYYGAPVLEAAGKAGVFPAGTHMYVNHQTASERNERPEGDLTGLAAVLQEAAYWDGEALVARAKPFQHWAPVLAEMKDSIGVSIRASAEISEGEADGRRGIIVDELVEAQSVDFVTRAGRGGRIREVLESAHAATIATTQNVPASSAGHTTTTESQKGNHMHQIEEAQYAQLTADAAKVPTLIAERDDFKARADKAEADLAEAKQHAEMVEAKAVAADRATAAAKAANLPPLAADRAVREALREVPMRDGKLDLSPFDAKVAECVKVETDYIAALAPQSISGFGGGTVAESGTPKARPNPWAGRNTNTGKVA